MVQKQVKYRNAKAQLLTALLTFAIASSPKATDHIQNITLKGLSLMLSQELIFAALDAEREGKIFTIDFDDFWQDTGYTRRDNAIKKLKNSRLKEGVDYVVNPLNLDTVYFTSKWRGIRTGRSSDKYYFTLDAAKSFVLSANTDEGEEARRYYIQIERQYRKQLERLLNLTTSDTLGYPCTLHQLWIDSGIVKKCQVREAITSCFTENKDYQIRGLEIVITESCYTILMLNFRSKKGIDRSKLPKTLKIDTEELYQYEQRKKANTRNPKARNVTPGQMELDLG